MLIQSWGLHLKWKNTCHVMLYYLNEWDTKTKIQVALFAFNFRLNKALGRGYKFLGSTPKNNKNNIKTCFFAVFLFPWWLTCSWFHDFEFYWIVAINRRTVGENQTKSRESQEETTKQIINCRSAYC